MAVRFILTDYVEKAKVEEIIDRKITAAEWNELG